MEPRRRQDSYTRVKSPRTADAAAEPEPVQFTPIPGVYSRAHRSAAPLAQLLPVLGDVTRLTAFRESFIARLEALRSAASLPGSEGSDRQSAGEEAMLSQVVQWLTSGE